MALSIGARLGPYEIVSPLGAGGMGEVFRARDTRLGRDVAIKVLPEDIAQDAARRQRFEHEARAAGSLSHPNLLTVFDVGAQDGTYYVVTELVDGESLRGVMKHGPLSARRIVEIGAQIAEGLAVAHAAGVVHRDVKPENVMLGRDGRVRILDFGIAKSRGPVSRVGEASETATSITDPGTVVGTTGYMSPEQVRGEEVDGRSDLFSLGIVLYELAAGKKPFEKPTSVETMTAILREDVERFPENLGAPLESVVRRCLEKNAGRRFQSAADLAFSLRSSTSGSTAISAMPQPAGPRWRWSRLAVAAVAVVVGIASFIAGRRTSPEKLPDWSIRPLTAYPGREFQPALSPDGSQVAFNWDGDPGKQPGIYVRLVDSEPPLRVSTGNGTAPCWSPDGKRIAFLRRNQIVVVPALGGPERTLAEFPAGNVPLGYNISWSPDGNWIAASTEAGLSAVRLQTGEIRQWVRSGNDIAWAAFSPNGKQIAFMKGASFSRFLYVLNLSSDGNPTGEPRRISSREFNPAGLVWSGDGKSLIVSAGQGSRFFLWRVDTTSGIAHTLPIDNGSAQQPAVSYSSGRLAYARIETDTNIWRAEAQGSHFSTAEPFIHSTSIESDIQFCPDGKRIVFRSERTGESAIWRSERDGSNQIPITRVEGARVGSPRCSPDGRWVVFDGYHEGNSDLYVVNAEGGEAKRLTKTPWDEFRPVFTMDGKWVVFGTTRSDGGELWKIPAAGGEPVQITHDGGHEAFPSGDGKFLYYTKSRGEKGIWRMPVEGGAPVRVAEYGEVGHWAVAGANLYWGEAPRDQPGQISVFNPETRKTSALISLAAGVNAFGFGTSLAVSSDEKTILFTRTDRRDSDLMLVENFR